jgi:DHA1 family tetracycline resistance protein-like MFS transporter
MNKIKALVLMTVFIDIVGVGIIIPVLPYYIKSFGTSDVVVTLLVAVFALLSFVSAPMLGTLSDKIGRRPVLIGSIISTSIGWLIFAWAPSVIWLFIGRIIDGLAAGNITTAQSSMADISTDDKTRASNMGLIGALFGIGFIVGPVIGGLLGSIGPTVPFWFVGILAGINAILAYFFLPETHHTKNTDTKVSLNPMKPVIDGFRNREMRALFGIWFLFGVGVAIQQGTFALYMANVFGYTESMIGVLFGIIGVLIVINQMALMKQVWLKYFKEKVLAQIMLVVFSFGMVLISVPTIVVFGIGIILTTFGQGTLRGVFSSMIAGFNPNKRGEYLGISMSIMSLSMVVGPLIATATFGINPHIPFIIAGIIGMIAFGFMKLFPLRHIS